jgi:hypothetical protein
LAISNQLLALMDSKLQLISKYGDGSDFSSKLNFKIQNQERVVDEYITASERGKWKVLAYKKGFNC